MAKITCITTVYNDTGSDLTLTELGFPCAGPMTEDYGWLVWLGLGGLVAPTGDAYTADYFGQFTPVDPGPWWSRSSLGRTENDS